MLFGRPPWRLLQAALSTWGRGSGYGPRHAGADAEQVRLVMRELLAQLEPHPLPLPLSLAIARCKDVTGLWHLRGGLMQAMSVAWGEAHARRQMAAVDAAFLEVWPTAPVSRWQELG